jgi:hypothetical protein
MGIASLSLHLEIGVNSLVVLTYLCSFFSESMWNLVYEEAKRFLPSQEPRSCQLGQQKTTDVCNHKSPCDSCSLQCYEHSLLVV